MANFGKAQRQKDYLSRAPSKTSNQRPLQARLVTVLPQHPAALLSPGSPVRISFEDGQRILKAAARRRSEPSPVEIVQAIDSLNARGLEKQEAQQEQDDDVTLTIDIDTIIASYQQAVSLEGSTQPTIPAKTSSSIRNSFRSSISSTSSRSTERFSRRLTRTLTTSLSRTPAHRPEVPMRPVSLLIASLGNPPPYHSTRHSAGHIILQHLQRALSLPGLTKSRTYAGGAYSSGAEAGKPEISLWQSPTLMNVSGPTLLKAWKQFVTEQAVLATDPITGLVVLHDEMELDSGRTKLKRGESSARGHNGIKSVQNSLASSGDLKKLGTNFMKVAVGIGRPGGGTRERGDVSAYVLGQLTSREKDALEAAANQLSFELYQEIARIGKETS